MLETLLNPGTLLATFGYAGLFLVIFAESGLFFGFFFPGDSLLFTAGFLASQDIFSIEIVWIGTMLAAVLGDQVGYWFGKKFGEGFFNKPNSFFRKPKRIQQAEAFYEKHGKKTIVLARFIPAVRTFAPIAAGIGKMKYQTFVAYNVIGGILWSTLFVWFGFFLGKAIPDANENLTLIVLVIIAISLVPIALGYWKSREKTVQKV